MSERSTHFAHIAYLREKLFAQHHQRKRTLELELRGDVERLQATCAHLQKKSVSQQCLACGQVLEENDEVDTIL